MPDVIAIVSKAVFEKAAGKSPKVGTKLGMDRYVSANKGLAPVGQGGKLYLVTVRPPDESLWLVAVLDNPEFDGEQWTSGPSRIAITDISRWSSCVSSILLWLIPFNDCTNIITVGIPARETSAASWSGPDGMR